MRRGIGRDDVKIHYWVTPLSLLAKPESYKSRDFDDGECRGFVISSSFVHLSFGRSTSPKTLIHKNDTELPGEAPALVSIRALCLY